MRVSVLDQSPVPEGSTGADALHNTLDLARLTDRLGYHRYWVAEHHGGPMLASASPEALIGPIAAVTEGIRVGSGGVMLPYYSPLKVAETFTILAALYPGRIDLGLGRAPGTDPLTAFALQRDRRQAAPDDFPQQLAELLGYLGDSLAPDHPFGRLGAMLPGRPELPVPWMLGSSAQSAIWAGELGLPYAFADFINPGGSEIAALYREHFLAGAAGRAAADVGVGGAAVTGAGPQTAVAVWALCARDDDEAQRLASSSRMTFTLLRRGQLIAVPPPETALEFLAREHQPASGALPRRGIVGTPERVAAGLEELAREYLADEVIVVTITHDHAARRRSYELIAQAMGLRERGLEASRGLTKSL
ncbi:MAG: LLM class flavin-dependent oxidoreductase [Solirubrobacteraceae bacterium]